MALPIVSLSPQAPEVEARVIGYADLVRDDLMKRDLRKYARTTTIRLFLGGVLILLIVGNALVWWLYGETAVRTSLLCMLVFGVPVLLAFGGLAIMDWIVRRNLDE